MQNILVGHLVGVEGASHCFPPPPPPCPPTPLRDAEPPCLLIHVTRDHVFSKNGPYAMPRSTHPHKRLAQLHNVTAGRLPCLPRVGVQVVDVGGNDGAIWLGDVVPATKQLHEAHTQEFDVSPHCHSGASKHGARGCHSVHAPGEGTQRTPPRTARMSGPPARQICFVLQALAP